jgi:hypothetical protein
MISLLVAVYFAWFHPAPVTKIPRGETPVEIIPIQEKKPPQ